MGKAGRPKTRISAETPRVKDVLILLGQGTLLLSLFLFPGAGAGIKVIQDMYRQIHKEKDFSKWSGYDSSRLKFLIKRLRRKKLITVNEQKDFGVVKLTEKGKQKVLKYNIGTMKLTKPEKWDRKWRLIIYDISQLRRRQQTALRLMFRQLEFLPLQKSVYLTPFPCEKEVTFLREYFGVGEEVMYLIVEKLENQDIYKTHFGLT